MIAVFKREFISAFSRLYGYITVGVALIASAIIFSVYNLTYAVETVNSTYSMISVIMALMIPVVALGAFADKKKGNADSQKRTALTTCEVPFCPILLLLFGFFYLL